MEPIQHGGGPGREAFVVPRWWGLGDIAPSTAVLKGLRWVLWSSGPSLLRESDSFRGPSQVPP